MHHLPWFSPLTESPPPLHTHTHTHNVHQHTIIFDPVHAKIIIPWYYGDLSTPSFDLLIFPFSAASTSKTYIISISLASLILSTSPNHFSTLTHLWHCHSLHKQFISSHILTHIFNTYSLLSFASIKAQDSSIQYCLDYCIYKRTHLCP